MNNLFGDCIQGSENIEATVRELVRRGSSNSINSLEKLYEQSTRQQQPSFSALLFRSMLCNNYRVTGRNKKIY